MHTDLPMKSASLPSLRVEPALRDAVESVLLEGETLSGFMETAVRETIERRRVRSEFVARGLVSREQAQRSGVYIPAAQVHAEMQQMLTQAAARVRK